jgi:hypothetical protein
MDKGMMSLAFCGGSGGKRAPGEERRDITTMLAVLVVGGSMERHFCGIEREREGTDKLLVWKKGGREGRGGEGGGGGGVE